MVGWGWLMTEEEIPRILHDQQVSREARGIPCLLLIVENYDTIKTIFCQWLDAIILLILAKI